MVAHEVVKFLEPVSSQLELKEKNGLTAIHLIISNEYSENILRHFTGQQNLVLDSVVYYEDDRGKLTSNLPDSLNYL
jgi:hypothetical protein